MMTPAPTATADSCPSEGKAAIRERSRTTITPTASSQYTVKKPCIRNKANEEDKICPPGPKTEKKGGDTEQKRYPKRNHATWGDIGLIEYNPHPAKWECRFEHCQHGTIAARSTYYRRKKLHPEQSIGGNKKETTCPYCNKTYRD